MRSSTRSTAASASAPSTGPQPRTGSGRPSKRPGKRPFLELFSDHKFVNGRGIGPSRKYRNKPLRLVFDEDWIDSKFTPGETSMRIGYAFSVAALAIVAFGATAVLAQQDPIEARKAMMKGNGQATAAAAKMVKGEAPFDLATAKKTFATYQEAAAKMPDLFPANSKTGGEATAPPPLWEGIAA